MKPVLFASTKPLERAENLRTMYESYDGDKAHVQVNPWRKHPEIRSGKYDLMVIDEYPTESPGKAILIGHGIEGGKTVGLDQPYPYYRREEGNLITYHIVGGAGMVECIAKCDGIPKERVLPLGLPRTDEYVTARKGDGKTFLTEKRSYLYAPTYRTREEPPLPDIDWEWLDESLRDDEQIVVKVHTMTQRILKRSYRHIVEIDPYEPTAPYLMDCDAVISDYSTVIFDGYLLGKPAVLLEKQEGYTEARGMYLQYPEQYCPLYCTNEQEMLKMLREANGLTATEQECLHLVADACDGHATERVCQLIHRLAE